MLTLSAFKYQKGLEKEVKDDSFKIALCNFCADRLWVYHVFQYFIQDAFNIEKSPKSNKRSMAQNHHMGGKKGRPKNGQKMHSPEEPKKGEG
jgi:hypothetical protein